MLVFNKGEKVEGEMEVMSFGSSVKESGKVIRASAT